MNSSLMNKQVLHEPKLDDYGITQEDVDKQGGYKTPSESFKLALIFGVVSMLASIFLRQEIYELLGVPRKDTYSFFLLIFFSGIFGAMIGGTIEAIINSIIGKEPKESKVNKYLRDKESYDKKIREVKRAEQEKQKQISTSILEAKRVQREKEESNLRSIHREKNEYWYSLIGKGVEFEKTLAELFKALGYEVNKTPASGDQGIDLILKKGKETIVVQCKCVCGCLCGCVCVIVCVCVPL